MPRTTIHIDAPVLQELKKLQKQEGKSLGALVSSLLQEALSQRQRPEVTPAFQWISAPMQARVDILDKDAVYDLLDRTDT